MSIKRFFSLILATPVLFLFFVGGEEESYTLVAAGDISCPKREENKKLCQGQEVYQAFAEEGAAPVLALGDLLQKSRNDYTSYQENFFRTWPINPKRLKPVAGNHDYEEYRGRLSKKGYDRFLDSRGLGEMKDWYSWDAGQWHFVALNSNCDLIDCSLDGKQLTWLAKDLAQSRGKCLAAYFHHPLFLAEGREQMKDEYGLKNIWRLLDLWQASFILNGHMHYYERTVPLSPEGEKREDGIRQFTVGSGGVSLFGVRDHHLRETAKQTYGYLRLNFSGERYSWSFIDRDKDVLDGGQESCRKRERLSTQEEYLRDLKGKSPEELRKTLLRSTG